MTSIRRRSTLPSSDFRFLLHAADRHGKTTTILEALAKSGIRIPPIVPAAITEVGRAAREQRGRLAKAEARGKLPEAAWDGAIVRLPEVFHASTTAARDYRGRLIDFVSAALGAARLPVPDSEEKV